MDAAFADADAQMRRGPAIAAACGEGISVIAPDDGGDAVLRAFLPRTEDDDAEAALEAAFGAEDSRAAGACAVLKLPLICRLSRSSRSNASST